MKKIMTVFHQLKMQPRSLELFIVASFIFFLGISSCMQLASATKKVRFADTTLLIDGIDEIKRGIISVQERELATYKARTLICSFHKHSSSWSDNDFDRFIANLDLTPTCVTALDNHQMNWAKTVQDRMSIYVYLNSIGDTKSNGKLWSKCSLKDFVLWETAVSQILALSVSNDSTSFDILGKGCGAEDHTLNVLRRIDPSSLNAFIISSSLSPHIAHGFMRLVKGENFDKFVYGEDEANLKSPWSLWKFVVFPGSLSVQYFWEFIDTNPIESFLLIIIAVASDVSFFVEVLIFFKDGQHMFAIKSFAKRNFFAICGTFASYCFCYFILKFLPSTLDCYSILLELAMCLIVIPRLLNLKNKYMDASKHNEINRKVVEKAVETKMINELKKIKAKELFTSADWKESFESASFERGVRAGEGNFKQVYLGKSKLNGEKVAIAVVKDEEEEQFPEIKEILFDILKAVTFGNKDTLEDNFNKALQKFKKLDDDKLVDFKHEITVLKAIATLKHRSLVEIKDAFNGTRPGEKFVLVMKAIIPLTIGDPGTLEWNPMIPIFSQDSSLSEVKRKKLSIIQTLFSVLATLHSANICHRDLKPANIGVREDDQGCAVVLDMGSWHLPGEFNLAEKNARTVSDTRYLSPECLAYSMEKHVDDGIKTLGVKAFNERVKRDIRLRKMVEIVEINKKSGSIHNKNLGTADDEMARVVAQNFKGPPLDVWAAAITAVQILVDLEDQLSPEDVPSCLFTDNYRKIVATEWSNKHIDTLLGVFSNPKNRAGDIDPALKELLRGMLNVDRTLRPTMKEAANLKYFKDNKIGEFAPPNIVDHCGVGAATNNISNTAPPRPTSTTSTSVAQSSSSASSSSSWRREVNKRVRILRELIATGISRPETSQKLSEATGEQLISKLLDYFKTTKGKVSKKGTFLKELNKEQWNELFDKVGLNDIFPALEKSALFNLLDFNNNGFVSKGELFSGIFILLKHIANEKVRLKLLFHAFDKDGNGALSRNNEFVDMLKFLDSSLTAKECKEYFDTFCQHESHQGEQTILTYDRFVNQLGPLFVLLMEDRYEGAPGGMY